ncbi:MAG: CoA-acylating methylmalonate-semialdehyde dehydrogenase, partial [Pseudomonadota bacterium]
MSTEDKRVVGHYIGGQSVIGTSGREGSVYNPATNELIRNVALADAAEVDKAVSNAAEAFHDWAEMPPARRVQVLYRYRELLIQNIDEMARLLSSEHGKTVDDAKGSITRGLEVVEFACGIPQLLKGEFSESVASGVDSWSMRQPLGVVAGITPFNFPAMVPMWMFPVAIACGNTFVLKPSERNPSCAAFMANLLTEAGLPDGVLNVVNGDKEAVDSLLSHPSVQAVSFVGSTAVGEYVYQTGCAHGKRVQALCGAKNHMVVMPDADMGQVVDAVMGAAYGSAGERCMAISVVVAVGEDTADRMMEQLVPRIETLKVGAYDQAGVEMGPVITPDARDRIKNYIDRGVEEGADLVVDGRNISIPGYESGCFVGATVFDRVKPEMAIYRDEIFGPVLSVVRAESYEAALQLVNDHEYGNGTAIFTRDGDA